MGYYEKTQLDQCVELINRENVSSVIYHLGQLNVPPDGIEVQIENVPVNLIGF